MGIDTDEGEEAGEAHTGPPPAAVRSLLRDWDFVKLWIACTTASLGSQVSVLALPLAAILLLHSGAFQVGLLAALGTLPYLLVGLPAGVWLERLPRRPVLAITAFARMALMCLVPATWALGRLTLLELDVVAFTLGILTTLFDIAWQVYLPGLVDRGRLHSANAYLWVSSSGAQLAGPGLGGALVGALSAPTALLADAIGFLAAGLVVLGIRRREIMGEVERRPSLVREIAEGMRFVVGHRYLRPIAMFTGANNAVVAALNVVLIVYEAKVLHMGAGAIGVVFLIGNTGLLLGTALVRPLASRLGVGRTLLLGAVLIAFGPLLLPLATPLFAIPLLIGGWFLQALGSPLYGANQVSLRLAITPRRLLARMTATIKFFVMGSMPIGSFLAGAAAAAIGLRNTLWLIAAISAASILTVLLTELRRVEVGPDELHRSDEAGEVVTELAS